MRRWSFWSRALFLLSALLLVFAAACDDDSPTDPTPPPDDNGTPPPPTSQGLLRAAQLSLDGRTVDLVVNGEVVAEGIAYPGVSDYVPLDAGQYRVQFFPAGNRQAALIETTLTLASGEARTAALIGLSSFDVHFFADDRATTADRSRLELVNAVPDFPSPFTLAIRNGPVLFQNVDYLAESGLAELIPGVYDLELRRGSSSEVVATATGLTLDPSANYTIFAVGTLRRNDVDLFLARDAP